MTLIFYNTKTNKLWIVKTSYYYWENLAEQFVKGVRRFYRWDGIKHEFIGVL